MTVSHDPYPAFLDDWAKMPGWIIKEQAALLLELDPDKDIPEGRRGEYDLLVKVLRRAKSMRLIKSPIAPKLFIDWANQNPLPVSVPSTLQDILGRTEIKDWSSSTSVAQRGEKSKVRQKASNWTKNSGYKTVMAAVLCMAMDKYRHKLGNKGSASANISKTIGKYYDNPPTSQTVRTLLARAEERMGQVKKIVAEIKLSYLISSWSGRLRFISILPARRGYELSIQRRPRSRTR